MKRIVLILAAASPALALAHPDHSTPVYNLAHYFTGSHLVSGALIALAVYAGYRLIRRVLEKETH